MASERVFVIRTAHNQRSTLVVSTSGPGTGAIVAPPAGPGSTPLSLPPLVVVPTVWCVADGWRPYSVLPEGATDEDRRVQEWLDHERPGTGPVVAAVQVTPRSSSYGMLAGILLALVAGAVAEYLDVLDQPGAATVLVLFVVMPVTVFLCIRIALVAAWSRWRRTIGVRPKRNMVMAVLPTTVILLAGPSRRSPTFERLWDAPRSAVSATMARRSSLVELRTVRGVLRLTSPRVHRAGAERVVNELGVPPGVGAPPR